MVDKKTTEGKILNDVRVDGVIGIIMDVTELRNREMEVEEETREKRQAIANEAAAKEANRLKSQFLANVRTSASRSSTAMLNSLRCPTKSALR